MERAEGTRWFLIVWSMFCISLGIAVLLTDQLELHRSMHRVHSPALDTFFTLFTHLGDGVVPTVMALLVLAVRDVRSFLMMAISCAGSAIVIQVLKRVFAHDRPFMFKADLGDMHWVPGLELHHHLSFPSGHSTAAWAMCYALVVLLPGRMNGVLFAVLAAMIAYSRVYLSQHFTEDILAGAIIGTGTAWSTQRWLYSTAMMERAWPGKRLFGQRNQ